MKNTKNNWFKILAIIFLLLALGMHPYGFYQLLRWVITATALHSAYLAYLAKKNLWMWVFGIMAVLFNPIAPFYLDRSTWCLLDVLGALVFIISLIPFKTRKNA
ncbi:MAG: hypothetical protein M3Q24_01385 [bacterium]|nr:hypothetical protein [bacterium]